MSVKDKFAIDELTEEMHSVRNKLKGKIEEAGGTVITPSLERAADCFYRRAKALESPTGKGFQMYRASTHTTFNAWKPDEKEKCACCDNLAPPTWRWPYSHFAHCKSVKHIACHFGVNATELMRLLREKKYIKAPKQREKVTVEKTPLKTVMKRRGIMPDMEDILENIVKEVADA